MIWFNFHHYFVFDGRDVSKIYGFYEINISASTRILTVKEMVSVKRISISMDFCKIRRASLKIPCVSKINFK